MATIDGSESFIVLADKINNLFFGQTAKDLKLLDNILDELSSINYKCAIVTNETVSSSGKTNQLLMYLK